jgi:hypothetical protein
MAYYNTNHETGDTLKQSWEQTENQEDLILKYFRDNYERSFSPETIHEQVLPTVPITSVRRAITNLTDKGHLLKTPEMVEGKYGKKIHTWRAILSQEQLTIF